MSRLAIPFALFALSCAPSPAQVSAASPASHASVAEGGDEAAPVPVPEPPPPPPPTRIVFGSCNDLNKPQVLWEQIAQLAPTAFVWLGDIVYADTQDITLIRRDYDELKALPAYAALVRQTRVVGTWDDHDYGGNDAGKEYPKRAESQQALLDFLDEPADSPRRTQAGVYTSVDLGADPYRVRVILLDTRYHRDKPGPAGDILGEEQWTWLRSQLEGSTAAVHVLGSSIQLIAEQHGFEKWSNFPSAKARLLQLLDETAPRNLMVISGDRHFAELSKLERAPGKPPLYDLTSSSLSKPWLKDPQEPNRFRVGEVVWDVNFGVIDVDWAAPAIHLQVRRRDNTIGIDQTIPLEGPAL